MSELLKSTEESNFYKFLSVDFEFNKIKGIVFEYSKNYFKNDLNYVFKEYRAGNLNSLKNIKELELGIVTKSELCRFFTVIGDIFILKHPVDDEFMELELNDFADGISDSIILKCKDYLIEFFGTLVLEHEFKIVNFININNSIEFQICCTSKTKPSFIIQIKINYFRDSNGEFVLDIKSNFDGEK